MLVVASNNAHIRQLRRCRLCTEHIRDFHSLETNQYPEVRLFAGLINAGWGELGLEVAQGGQVCLIAPCPYTRQQTKSLPQSAAT